MHCVERPLQGDTYTCKGEGRGNDSNEVTVRNKSTRGGQTDKRRVREREEH